jgi:glycosyltransferase involved in cell wall biosynthesis
LIEDGVTGLLCACKDDEAMAAAIRRLLEAAQSDRDGIAKAGNAGLHARHGQESIVRSYLDLYHDVLDERIKLWTPLKKTA